MCDDGNSKVFEAALRYPFDSEAVLPEVHQKYLVDKVYEPYGNSMRQIVAMPMGYSADHPGAHLQLVDPRAYVKPSASIVPQPFHVTALHRIFSNQITEKMIREKIVPEICNRLNAIREIQQDNPITIESHFDPCTHKDAAHWEPDPDHMSIRFVSAGTPRNFFVRIESRSNPIVGKRLGTIAENMSAREYAKDPRVQWAENLQKRTIGRLLDICSDVVEEHTKHPIAQRINDEMAKVNAHEMPPRLAVNNGPMTVANTVRYIGPKFKTSSIPNDPRTQGLVGFYANCAGEARKGVLLEGNHNDPLFELHGVPEIDPARKNLDGTNVYRSPLVIGNNVFGALPTFQPRLDASARKQIIDSYEKYPSQRETIQSSIVSLKGSASAQDLAPYFSRFRTPTEVELKTATCEMSRNALGLSGAYQRYDPVISIVP